MSVDGTWVMTGVFIGPDTDIRPDAGGSLRLDGTTYIHAKTPDDMDRLAAAAHDLAARMRRGLLPPMRLSQMAELDELIGDAS